MINNVNKTSNLTDYLTFDSSKSSSSSTESFDKIFTKTDTQNYQKDSQKHYLKDDFRNKQDNKKIDKKVDKNNDFSKKTKPMDRPDKSELENVKVDEKVSNEETVKPTDKTQVKEKADVEDVKDVKKEVKVSDEGVKELAQVLNIEPEKLVEILNKLNLAVEDLTENSEVTKLLVEVHEISSKFDLLTIPNLKEELAKIKEIAQNANTEVSVDETESVDATNYTSEISDETQNSSENSNNSSTNSNAQSQTIATEYSKTYVEANVENSDNFDEVADENLDVPISEDTKGNVSIGNNQVSNEAIKSGAGTVVENTNTNNVVGLNPNSQSIDGETFLEKASKSLGNEKNVDTENVIKQLMDAMKVEVKSDITSEIKIMLRPQHLGDVTLKIITENGLIVAQFEAENQRVKEIIESNFNSLKDSLESQGIQVSSLQVNINNDYQANSFENNGESNNSQNGNSDKGTGETSTMEDEAELKAEEININRALGSTNSFKA